MHYTHIMVMEIESYGVKWGRKKQCTCFSFASVNYQFICCLGLRSYMHIYAVHVTISSNVFLESFLNF
jgi:hypothetical protein